MASERITEPSTPATPPTSSTAPRVVFSDALASTCLTPIEQVSRLQEEAIGHLRKKNYGKALLACTAIEALDQKIYSRILNCIVKCVYHGIEPGIEALDDELQKFVKDNESKLFRIASSEALDERQVNGQDQYEKGMIHVKHAINMSIVDAYNYFHTVEDGSRIWSTRVIGLAILNLRQRNYADAIRLLAEGMVDREISDLETLYLRGLLSLAYVASGHITEGLNELNLLSDFND